jgi:hypothetical protein
MGLFRVVRLVPLQEAEHEIQHVGAGFLDGGLGGACDLAADRVE